MVDSDSESPPGRGHGGAPNQAGGERDQDRFLPIANVGRIMKKELPANAKISKDAKETVQECVSEFISSVTGEASEKCQREKRKKINGDDLLWAMATLGFEDYVEPFKVYQRFKELEGDKIGAVAEQDGGGGFGSSNESSVDRVGGAYMMMGGHHQGRVRLRWVPSDGRVWRTRIGSTLMDSPY